MNEVLAGLITESYSSERFTDWSEAVELWVEAVQRDPGDALAHNNLGNAYSSQQRFLEAKLHYEVAIHLDPMLAEAYYNLANQWC